MSRAGCSPIDEVEVVVDATELCLSALSDAAGVVARSADR
jgi:hypothetical protein